jgi:hypothetical protein
MSKGVKKLEKIKNIKIPIHKLMKTLKREKEIE